MKIITKKVYYCDYCNKRYLSKYWCMKHEKHCTANINRECRMCDKGGTLNNIADIIETYKATYKIIESDSFDQTVWLTEKPLTWQFVADAVDGCPMCTLAVIRKLHPNIIAELNYKYKEHIDLWWANHNEYEGSETW